MSTQYEPIVGDIEYPLTEEKRNNYVPALLHISRFFGGKDRGVSIQLGIENEYDNSYSHIQLDNKSANALLELLREALGHVSIEELGQDRENYTDNQDRENYTIDTE